MATVSAAFTRAQGGWKGLVGGHRELLSPGGLAGPHPEDLP